MITIYKGDKSCMCDRDQLPAMEAGGWSRTKPTQDAKPKTVLRKKVIPKQKAEG